LQQLVFRNLKETKMSVQKMLRGIRMNKLLLCALLAVSVPSIAAADSVQVVSGGTTVTVGGSGSTTYSNSNLNGWNITIAFGSSNSPNLSPFGLDLNVLASCNGAVSCASNPVDIFYSDTNFSAAVPAGGFQTTYSATITGSGTTNEIAWANSSNTLFALGGTNKIGAGVGSFSALGGFGTAAGGPAETGPYSLTIEDILNANGGSASFSTDANVIAAPEPSSLALLGSGLLVLPLALKRRQTKVGQ
jgi:hypothetical protein